jgi:hypothetical protein
VNCVSSWNYYYSGRKIFNNLLWESKNIADNIKKFKTALKQCLYIYIFYTLEEYFNQSSIMYCVTKIDYYIGISFDVLSYGTLYKYSLIFYNDLIFSCINLMTYLYIVFIKLLFFYCHDSFFTVPTVIFNDMIYMYIPSSGLWNNR